MSLNNCFDQIDRLISIVNQFNETSIGVLGDLMIDKYILGEVNRISPEAPVPVLLVADEIYKPGGAANVAKNIVAMGAKTFLFGVLGDDQTGLKFTFDLQREGINPEDVLLIPGHTSTLKCRIVANNQQICRLDYETSDEIEAENIKQLLDKIDSKQSEITAITISDYNKGVVNNELMLGLKKIALKSNILLIANPKPYNIKLYSDFDLVTLNRSEALSIVGNVFNKNLDNITLVQNLHKETRTKHTVMTAGHDGIYLCWGNQTAHFPGLEVEVYDVTGAGDTVNSILTMALAAKADILQALVLANFGGALVVRKLGVATINQNELIDSLKQNLSNYQYKVY